MGGAGGGGWAAKKCSSVFFNGDKLYQRLSSTCHRRLTLGQRHNMEGAGGPGPAGGEGLRGEGALSLSG